MVENNILVMKKIALLKDYSLKSIEFRIKPITMAQAMKKYEDSDNNYERLCIVIPNKKRFRMGLSTGNNVNVTVRRL